MTVVTPSAFAAVSEMPSVYFVGQAPGLYLHVCSYPPGGYFRKLLILIGLKKEISSKILMKKGLAASEGVAGVRPGWILGVILKPHNQCGRFDEIICKFCGDFLHQGEDA